MNIKYCDIICFSCLLRRWGIGSRPGICGRWLHISYLHRLHGPRCRGVSKNQQFKRVSKKSTHSLLVTLPGHLKLYLLKPQQSIGQPILFANDNEANYHKS